MGSQSRTKRPLAVDQQYAARLEPRDPICPERTVTYYVRGVNSHGYGDDYRIDVERDPASSNPPARETAFTHAEVGRHKYRQSWTRGTRLYDPRDPVTTYHIYGDQRLPEVPLHSSI